MQNAFTLLIVAAAAGYLAWRTWSFVKRRKQSACGGCGSCASGDNTQTKVLPLVTIEPLSSSKTSGDPR
jgi:FeoB-associated Cys-rich membrane protein